MRTQWNWRHKLSEVWVTAIELQQWETHLQLVWSFISFLFTVTRLLQHIYSNIFTAACPQQPVCVSASVTIWFSASLWLRKHVAFHIHQSTQQSADKTGATITAVDWSFPGWETWSELVQLQIWSGLRPPHSESVCSAAERHVWTRWRSAWRHRAERQKTQRDRMTRTEGETRWPQLQRRGHSRAEPSPHAHHQSRKVMDICFIHFRTSVNISKVKKTHLRDPKPPQSTTLLIHY